MVVWYSYIFKNFPQFVVIHTVKGFSVVNEADVDVFLEFSCFLCDSANVGNSISGSSAFSKLSLYIWMFSVTFCWSLTWRILRISLLACEMSAIVWYSEHSLALPFFGIGMKTDLFQSCGYCWVFQICWHTECSILMASSFRIWNSSAEIPSPLLALFIVRLPKAYLTSHSRMSGSRCMIPPLWLSGSWRSFFCIVFCVLWLPLLNIFCFC